MVPDHKAGARWKEAKEIFFENLNIGLSAPQLRPRLLKSSPRKALSSVINILASPVKLGESKRGQDQLPSPVVISPSKLRHRMFAEVSFTNLKSWYNSFSSKVWNIHNWPLQSMYLFYYCFLNFSCLNFFNYLQLLVVIVTQLAEWLLQTPNPYGLNHWLCSLPGGFTSGSRWAASKMP